MHKNLTLNTNHEDTNMVSLVPRNINGWEKDDKNRSSTSSPS